MVGIVGWIVVVPFFPPVPVPWYMCPCPCVLWGAGAGAPVVSVASTAVVVGGILGICVPLVIFLFVYWSVLLLILLVFVEEFFDDVRIAQTDGFRPCLGSLNSLVLLGFFY